MTGNKLPQYQEEYDRIMHVVAPSQRYDALAELMANMETEYRISTVHNAAWEKDNRDVITLYHKVSTSRWR